MNKEKTIYLTKEGLEELQNELNYLKVEKRKEVVLALKEARALGDLSENAEYDSARDEQAALENRILELEDALEHAAIIKKTSKNKVSVGTSVTIKYLEDGESEEYFIVGIKEADPFENKISNESPIAVAIMGKKVGDVVEVASPNGKYEVEITNIA